VVLTAALLAVVAGSIVYSLLTLIAARDYLGQANRLPHHPRDPISVLKPLSGAEERLEQNLRSFFLQQYQDFEILFAVRRADDPAVAVVEKLRAEYPAVAGGRIGTREPPKNK
jgi:ceramide glucosyltransferase